MRAPFSRNILPECGVPERGPQPTIPPIGPPPHPPACWMTRDGPFPRYSTSLSAALARGSTLASRCGTGQRRAQAPALAARGSPPSLAQWSSPLSTPGTADTTRTPAAGGVPTHAARMKWGEEGTATGEGSRVARCAAEVSSSDTPSGGMLFSELTVLAATGGTVPRTVRRDGPPPLSEPSA